MTKLRSLFFTLLTAGIAIGLLGQTSFAQEGNPSELRVYPANVNLSSARDRQSIQVQAVYPSAHSGCHQRIQADFGKCGTGENGK